MTRVVMALMLLLCTISCDKAKQSERGEVDGITSSEQGIYIDVTTAQSSRVTVEGDRVSESHLEWEEGDEIIVVHSARTYIYLATESGRQVRFLPKDEQNRLTLSDITNTPVAAFYNVRSVDAATLRATFDVACNQSEGAMNNTLPLYAYSDKPTIDGYRLSLTMQPLASIVELEIGASRDWHADKVVLESSVPNGYATASGVTVDAATGRVDFADATTTADVSVELTAMHNFSTARRVPFVVMANMVESGVLLPIYYGAATVKLYKEGVENTRRTIWRGYAAPTEGVDTKRHIYQPITNIIADKVADGISTAEELKSFAECINSVEGSASGFEFANEDGVVALKNSIDISTCGNWIPIGCRANGTIRGFEGSFDGCGNTISGLTINHSSADEGLSALFGVISGAGEVKNLTVEGHIVENSTAESCAAGVVAYLSGGKVENCTSRVTFSVGESANHRVVVGGVVGELRPATADVTLEGCTNEATIEISYPKAISRYAVVGGVVAILGGGAEGYAFTVSRCHNSGDISLFNSGAASMVGGVAGYVNRVTEDVGTIADSTNSGRVAIGSSYEGCEALFVGGVTARQNGHNLIRCSNDGLVTTLTSTLSPASVYMGGIVGISNGGVNKSYIEECDNRGEIAISDINSLKGELCVGGVIGNPLFCCHLKGCRNIGAVEVDAGSSNVCSYVGGIAGLAGNDSSGYVDGIKIEQCDNSGAVTLYGSTINVQWSYAAGIVGACYGGADISAEGIYGAHITESSNSGVISARRGERIRAAGVAGLCNCAAICGCTNSGVVALERQTENADVIAGVVAMLDNSYSVVDGCVNSGTVCNLYSTAREEGSSSRHTYVLIGGLVGSGGGELPVISNGVSVGNILASHDRELEYDEYKGSWIADMSTTTQYRGVLCGNVSKKQLIRNCKVGGAVGSVTGGSGEDRYRPQTLHTLNDTEGDPYYWQRWVQGYTTVSVYESLDFAK